MQTFKKLFAIICAVYFLAAGSGYNLVRYCCDSCAEEGIEAVASKSCAGVHHQHQYENETCCNHDHSSHEDDMACSDINHQADGCHLLRLQTDTPSVDIAKFVQDDPEINLEISFAVLDLLLADYIQVERPVFVPPDKPFFGSGRDILSYHAVLLI